MPGSAEFVYHRLDPGESCTYPAIYVSTGLWDRQVQYYGPAKWARLRARKTDANPLLFRTDMTSGHSGKSGRFGRLRDDAEWHAFMLDRLGVKP